MKLSSRLDLFAEPETLKMAKLGRELRSQGIDVIDLSLGEPDFDTPTHIKDALKKAVDDNFSHYTPVAGYPDLREAVCTKLRRDNGLEYKQENILVSTGAKQSLANVVMAIVDKGDEVVIPTPYWVTYSEILGTFNPGDLIQLYIKVLEADLSYPAIIRNFRLYIAGIGILVITD
jgi:aspartate aminotransferase